MNELTTISKMSDSMTLCHQSQNRNSNCARIKHRAEHETCWRNRARSILYLAVVALLSVMNVASAQEESAENKDVFVLEEVVITAQKRPEKLSEVPVSASVVMPQAIENSNVSDVSDLNNLVPSIQLNGTISGRVPMGVRGISSVSNEQAVGISSGVSIQIDGVPVPSDSFAGNLVEDVWTIEVLKGPQSTLGGRTASSGVINYVTRSPTDYFTGGASITLTDDEEKRVKGHVSGPISEKVNFSLSGFYNYTPYPIENIQLNETTVNETYGGRGKLKWTPTDDFDAMLTLHYAKQDTTGFNFGYTYVSPGATTNFPPFWTQADVLTGITVDMDNQKFSSPVPDAGAMHEDKDIRLDMNFQLGNLTLTSITAYQNEDQYIVQDLFAINQYIYPGFTDFLINVVGLPDFIVYDPANFPHFENKQDIWAEISQFSQELKIVSPADKPISYVAGLFFSSTKVRLDQLRNFFDPNPGGAYVDILVKPKTETSAIYGRMTSKLNDTTSLVTGLRFNYDYINYTYDQIKMSGYGPYYSAGSDSSTAVVGDISLQKKLNSSSMIYGTYSRGYKPKGYNTATTLHSNAELTPVDQEKINHFEVGSKGIYFDYQLRLNASIFYTNYTDYQIQTFVTQPGATFPELNLQSAGEASTKGIELDMNWVPTSTFKMGFSAAYINAKFEEFTDAACYGNTADTRPPEPYCVENDDGVWVQDVSGKSMPNSPKFKFVVDAEKRFTLSNTIDLLVGGNYSYRTKAQALPNQNPYAVQDAFGLLNLHVTLDRIADRYSVTAFVNNLFDENYYVDLEDFWTGPWAGNVIIGQPARNASRYFGLRFSVNF